MEYIKISFLKSKDIRLIIIGIGLGLIFWILESVAHIIFFHETDFLHQLVNPLPHEIWMRLTVICMFIGFSIYAQMMIAARRKAEEETARAYAELNQIFDTAADGMRVIDKDFNIIRANNTFLQLSGLSLDDVIDKKCYDVFSGSLCNTENCPLAKILANPEQIQYDTEKIRKDGLRIPCIVTATPFKDHNGKIIGMVEDFKDITDRKTYEKEMLQSREQMRDLAAHLQVAVEKERKHIAREIHDELGQVLTVLKMDAYRLSNRLPHKDQMQIERAAGIIKDIDRAIQSVKRISSELRPDLIDHLGLTAAMEWQAEEFSQRTGVSCKVLSDPEDIMFDQELSIAIFRIFQETLTNVARHADAKNVVATVKLDSEKLELCVQDDGKGIEEVQISNLKSYGIVGMNERVHAFGGTLQIQGKKNQGTVINAIIPISMRESK